MPNFPVDNIDLLTSPSDKHRACSDLVRRVVACRCTALFKSSEDRLTVPPGVPIKQEPVSEASSPFEEPGPFYRDFRLFGAESVADFMACFDNNPLAAFAPVPGGHAIQDNTNFPL